MGDIPSLYMPELLITKGRSSLVSAAAAAAAWWWANAARFDSACLH
jgi:hypothetical protein